MLVYHIIYFRGFHLVVETQIIELHVPVFYFFIFLMACNEHLVRVVMPGMLLTH